MCRKTSYTELFTSAYICYIFTRQTVILPKHNNYFKNCLSSIYFLHFFHDQHHSTYADQQISTKAFKQPLSILLYKRKTVTSFRLHGHHNAFMNSLMNILTTSRYINVFYHTCSVNGIQLFGLTNSLLFWK